MSTFHQNAVGGQYFFPAASISNFAQLQENLPSIIKKRIISWDYLTKMFQGGMVFCNTALITEHDMRSAWSEERMQRRSQRFFYLGTSLGTILDIPNTIDFIKAINQVLQDYEALLSSDVKSKSIFFKATADDGSEYAHLEIHNIPFNLDYVITMTSLTESIRQVYEKLVQKKKDPLWTQLTLEAVYKLDNKFKKIMTAIYKEMEIMARDIMTEELNLIDPIGLPSPTSPNRDDDWEIFNY